MCTYRGRRCFPPPLHDTSSGELEEALKWGYGVGDVTVEVSHDADYHKLYKISLDVRKHLRLVKGVNYSILC